jgi:ABC-2 type transport system permease protein
MSGTLKGAIVVAKKDLLSSFVSPVAYAVVTGFLLLSGYFFFTLLGTYNLKLAQFVELPVTEGSVLPTLQQWVIEPYFQILIFLFVFCTPFLTMRTFAEERRRGTLELVFLSPLSTFSLVLGKLLGVFLLALIACVASFLFPTLLWIFSEPEGALLLSGAGAVLGCVAAFCAIGVLCSAFSENQLVGGGLTLCLLLLLYFSHSLADSVSPAFAEFFRNLSPVTHSEGFVRGALSLRSLSYFISLIGFAIYSAVIVVSYQRNR